MGLPHGTSEDPTAISPVDPASHVDPPSPAMPPESDVAALDDEDDERQWRAILAVELPRKVLFQKWVDISPGKLREWKPDPIVLPRELEDDDDE